MKTIWSSNSIVSNKARGSLFQKTFVVSMIMALLFALLPVASVFAAPARVTENDDLAQEWKNKIRNVRVQSIFYDRIQVVPADFENQDDLAQANALINKYGFALRRANTIISTHAGFDQSGRVTDEDLALQSVRDVAENLRIMRAVRMKLDELDYKIHRSK